MIDILIPLGKGSRHDNIELRYCLRSIEKHLSGVRDVWIVGEKPGWTKDVVHIPIGESSSNWNRARNIYQKIMAGIKMIGCYQDEPVSLSDNFLFMNDDHFLLTDNHAPLFPNYHRGRIELANFKQNIPQYTQYKNTIELLGPGLYDFGVHCPIVLNKERFGLVFKKIKWPEHGFEIKSSYMGWGIAETKNWVHCEDLKFHEPVMMKSVVYDILKDRDWFSVGDKTLKSGCMLEVLSELYPDKSKWEL